MKYWMLAGFALIIAGCNGIDTPSTETPSVNKSLSVLVPEYSDPGKLRLPYNHRYVTLGETEEHAMSVFPKASRSFPLEDSVPGFPSDFHARGWESNSEGFGVILHDDKVVLAMHQYEAVEADDFAAILDNVKTINNLDRFQAATIGNVDYWYVVLGTDELVVSRLPGAKKRYQATITVGNQRLVDALGILKDTKKVALPFQPDKHAQ